MTGDDKMGWCIVGLIVIALLPIGVDLINYIFLGQAEREIQARQECKALGGEYAKFYRSGTYCIKGYKIE